MPSLLSVERTQNIIAVYTQADRPAGRGLKLRATDVKTSALELGLGVRTPEKLDSDVAAQVQALKPDALVTVAYGKILPAALLQIPALAALNVHPSLLPAYRGATPIQAVLRDGLDRTGVSIIWMTPQMDAGDIALAREVTIDPRDDFGTLHDRLAQVAAMLIEQALRDIRTGTLGRVPQDEGLATYTKPLTKEDSRLNFGGDARAAANLVRSLSPRPGAWLELQGRRVKVLEARAETSDAERKPGTLVAVDGDGPLIACAAGALRLLRVVPEGRPAISGADFARSLKR